MSSSSVFFRVFRFVFKSEGLGSQVVGIISGTKPAASKQATRPASWLTKEINDDASEGIQCGVSTKKVVS